MQRPDLTQEANRYVNTLSGSQIKLSQWGISANCTYCSWQHRLPALSLGLSLLPHHPPSPNNSAFTHFTTQSAAYGLDLTYLAQPRVLKPRITAWLVTSFQTALLSTAEHLITGCGAPTDKLVKLQAVLPEGTELKQEEGYGKQGGYGPLLRHHTTTYTITLMEKTWTPSVFV